jgi:hypothetical protein
MLYTGTSFQLAAKGVKSLNDDKWYGGQLEWGADPCILTSDNEVGKQMNFDECTLKGATRSRPHFVVIGNSYSVAEFEMYAALNEGGLGTVTATSSWWASPVPEIPNNSQRARASAYYWSSVVPMLLSRLSYGDVLIMINDLEPFAPASATKETKSISIKRMQSLNEVLQAVQARNPNFRILDLLSIFCPEDVCKFYNDQGLFLYRDEFSHPSVEANYLSRPVFLEVVNKALAASNGIMRGAANER